MTLKIDELLAGTFTPVTSSGHMRRTQAPRYLLHELIAMKAFGRSLPSSSVIHHADGNPSNNANTNLVICQDQAYHMLLHALQRVLNAGGNPHTDKLCATCKTPKSKAAEFTRNASTWDGLHPECRPCKYAREAVRKRRQRADRREAAALQGVA